MHTSLSTGSSSATAGQCRRHSAAVRPNARVVSSTSRPMCSAATSSVNQASASTAGTAASAAGSLSTERQHVWLLDRQLQSPQQSAAGAVSPALAQQQQKQQHGVASSSGRSAADGQQQQQQLVVRPPRFQPVPELQQQQQQQEVDRLQQHQLEALQQPQQEQPRQQYHQQQRQRAPLTGPFLTGRLQRETFSLLAQGQHSQADALLSSTIRRIRTLDSLQRTAAELEQARLLQRPAAAVALVVQLGKLAVRAAKQQHSDRLAAAKAVRRTTAQAANHRRMLARRLRQQQEEQQQQQEQEQQQQQQEAVTQAGPTGLPQQQRQQLFACMQLPEEQQQQQQQSQGLPTCSSSVQQQQQLPRRLQRPQLRPLHLQQQQQGQQQQQQRVVDLSRLRQPSQQQSLRGTPASQLSSSSSSTAGSSSSTSRGGKALRPHRSQLKQKQRQKLKSAKLQRRLLLSPQQAYESLLTARLAPHQQQLQQVLYALKRGDASILSPRQLDALAYWLRQLRVQDGALWQKLQVAAQQQLLAGRSSSSDGSSSSGGGWSPAQLQVRLLWGLARQAAAAGSSRTRGSSPAAVGRSAGVVAAAGANSSNSSGSGGSKGRSTSPPRVQQQQQAANDPQQQQQQQRRQFYSSGGSNSSSGMPPSVQPEYVVAWLASSTPHLATFSPSQLAASIYSLALLQQQPPPAWQAAFFPAFSARLPRASPQDLSNTLWALARLGLSPDPAWWGAFQAAVAGQLWQFSGVAVANLIWAAAKLGLAVQPQLGDLLLWQAQRTLGGMDIQLLSSMLWGVVGLQLKPKRKWLHRFCDRVTTLSASLTPSYTASLLLSLSSLQHRPKYWMARTLTAVQPQLRAFSASDVAQTLVAFARMHYVPHFEWWFEFSLEARRVLLARANKQQLLMAADALAVLSSSGELRVAPELLAAVLARARTLLGVAGPAVPVELTGAGGAVTPQQQQQQPQPVAATAAVGAGAARSGSSGGSSGSSSFSAADCANLVQSLVHLHVAPGPPLLSGLYTTFVSLLPAAHTCSNDYAAAVGAAGAAGAASPGVQAGATGAGGAGAVTGEQVATMLWALGAFWRSNPECLWLRQHPELIAALVSAAEVRLEGLEPMHLKRCLVALAAMGYNPGEGFLLAHEAAVLGVLGEVWPKTLEHILRGYRELGFSGPGAGALREALAWKKQQQQQEEQERKEQQQQVV